MFTTSRSAEEINKTGVERLRRSVSRPQIISYPQRANGFSSSKSDAGNLATQRLLRAGVIQAKLNISQPGDAAEQEADRVAQSITETKSGPCHCGGSCSSCKSDGAQSIQRKSNSNSTALDSHVPDSFLQLLGPGQPLEPATRAFFENRFGYDFGPVRIHAGQQAVESAKSINAAAYTVGQDIVLGTGRHAMGTSEGKKLLAHELTHVVQQGGRRSTLQRTCAQSPDESFYKSAANYCKDTGFSGSLHPGQTCYREVPRRSSYFDCPPGDQVCFDREGKCHDSYDRASTVESKESDGKCNLHGLCFLKHAVLDIIPGLAHESGEEQARELMECKDSCKKLGGFSKTMCEIECNRSSRLLP